MSRLRDSQWFLILMFLGIIGSVPLIQTVIEARREEKVLAFEVFRQAPTAGNLRSFERNLEEANWAARLCRPWIQFAQFAWLKDGGEKAVIGQTGWFFYKPGLDYVLARPGTAKAGGPTNDPLPAIVAFRDQLAARGIQLVLMPVPNKETIYPERLTGQAGSGPGVLTPHTRDLLDRLRAARVEFIDLFKVFAEARQHADSTNRASLYLAQDSHWSPAGVELAAQTAARRLVEKGWVESGQVEFSQRAAPVQRLGDVLRMLQVPAIERRVKPEAVSSVEVVRKDNGELYKDTADAEILLLGDSFLRIYQRDEPGAAGFIAHLAKELKQPLISLVNDGGGSTLVRQELHRRPPFLKNKKVVLWEFVERDIGIGTEGWPIVPLPPVAAPTSTNAARLRGVATPGPNASPEAGRGLKN